MELNNKKDIVVGIFDFFKFEVFKILTYEIYLIV